MIWRIPEERPAAAGNLIAPDLRAIEMPHECRRRRNSVRDNALSDPRPAPRLEKKERPNQLLWVATPSRRLPHDEMIWNPACIVVRVPSVQWDKLFVFTISPIELFIRGSVVYLFILVLMRVLRREPGTVGIADLLMVVLIADASQNAMAGEYHSVLDGIVLILTIVFWNFIMDWLTLRSPVIERLTYPAPISLFENRKMNGINMKKQFVTHAQLLSMMREHGIDDLSRVKAIFMEGSGHVSVIPIENSEQGHGDEDERRSRTIG
jgi:uncharacterized membrane protein YcaP (DUF421 family)